MLANVIIEKEVGRMRRETAFRFAVHFIYTFFSPYLQTTTTPETNFFVPSIIAADVGMGAGIVVMAFGHFLNDSLDVLLGKQDLSHWHLGAYRRVSPENRLLL